MTASLAVGAVGRLAVTRGPGDLGAQRRRPVSPPAQGRCPATRKDFVCVCPSWSCVVLAKWLTRSPAAVPGAEPKRRATPGAWRCSSASARDGKPTRLVPCRALSCRPSRPGGLLLALPGGPTGPRVDRGTLLLRPPALRSRRGPPVCWGVRAVETYTPVYFWWRLSLTGPGQGDAREVQGATLGGALPRGRVRAS